MTPASISQPAALTCTAFDHTSRIATGPYVRVAMAVKNHIRAHEGAAVLIFDDATGKEIDFDLRGNTDDISARIAKRYPAAGASEEPRTPGRPKLGVTAREVTLLPAHWDWLAEQPGGASVTLRKLVEEAKRAPIPDKVRLRKAQERTYAFMSAMAGNLAGFEEASRALFANEMERFKTMIAKWPKDLRDHLGELYHGR